MKKSWVIWLTAIVGMINKQSLLEMKYKDEEIRVLLEIIRRNHKRYPLTDLRG